MPEKVSSYVTNCQACWIWGLKKSSYADKCTSIEVDCKWDAGGLLPMRSIQAVFSVLLWYQQVVPGLIRNTCASCYFYFFLLHSQYYNFTEQYTVAEKKNCLVGLVPNLDWWWHPRKLSGAFFLSCFCWVIFLKDLRLTSISSLLKDFKMRIIGLNQMKTLNISPLTCRQRCLAFPSPISLVYVCVWWYYLHLHLS